MKYSADEIERRLHLGEDSGREFKQVEFAGDSPVSKQRNNWADETGAFANHSGGVLLFSVTDKGEVIGMTREQMASPDRFLAEVGTDAIRPPVRIRTHHPMLSGGQLVLLMEVPESDVVHQSTHGYYHVRVGSTKRRMEPDERLRLEQRRSRVRSRWFDEQIVPDTRDGDLARIALEVLDQR